MSKFENSKTAKIDTNLKSFNNKSQAVESSNKNVQAWNDEFKHILQCYCFRYNFIYNFNSKFWLKIADAQ